MVPTEQEWSRYDGEAAGSDDQSVSKLVALIFGLFPLAHLVSLWLAEAHIATVCISYQYGAFATREALVITHRADSMK